MQVKDVMSKATYTVSRAANLHEALRLMWTHDVGVLPVVNVDNRVVGIITDRDIAMATFHQGKAPQHIGVVSAMARDVVVCKADETIADVETRMATRRVRRVPVVDETWQVQGMITLSDLARKAPAVSDPYGDGLLATLNAIASPRGAIMPPA